MKEEIRRTFLYTIERILVRGAHYRFLVVVAAIGIVSVVGGLLLVMDAGQPEGPGDAMWWAFLRLSDPGYLGDDEGLWRRVVSTVLTVLGYVIFLGAMVAILTQWLNDTLNRLEQGRTPIRQSGHVVILGWTNRTRTICRELVSAEGRLSRWLELRGVRRLKIAILAKQIGPERDLELRAALGRQYRRQQFVLRSGSYLRANHLRRVDLAHAASIVLPGIEATSPDALSHDAMVIKTLRAIAAEHATSDELPACVCEIFDPRKVPVARLAYRGAVEVLASDVIIGRLLGDSLRQPGASAVLDELLTHGVGGTLYARTWHEAPCRAADIRRRAGAAVFLGIASASRFRLAPPDDAPVDTDDALVFVARSYEDTDVTANAPAPESAAVATMGSGRDGLVLSAPGRGGRVLILGWSRRMPDLLAQLELRADERWVVDVLSAVDPDLRRANLVDHGVTVARTELRHLRGDLTVPEALVAVHPASYDRVFLVASDWPTTGDASDARTISTYIALSAILLGEPEPPPILVELVDEGNLELFDGGKTEVVVSPRILSRLLAQVVLRPQLNLVVDEIFGKGDTQLRFLPAPEEGTVPFGQLAGRLAAPRSIIIGVRRGELGGELILAPPPDLPIDFDRGDALIVLEAGPG